VRLGKSRSGHLPSAPVLRDPVEVTRR
jgi:hypothetical protein